MRVSRHRLLFLTTIVALICVGSAYSLHARSAVSDTSAHSQIRLSSAQRTVYVIPFSHWDTDWHRPFAFYAPLADQNILEAIRLAQQEQSFRWNRCCLCSISGRITRPIARSYGRWCAAVVLPLPGRG